MSTTTRSFRQGSAGRSSASRDSPAATGSRSGASTPVESVRTNRLDEKSKMQDLNNRLATYIETIRNLDNENQYLRIQLEETETTMRTENNKTRETFQRELDDTRRLLDETAREKARLQIEVDKLRPLNEDLKGKLASAEKSLKASEQEKMALYGQIQDLDSRLNKAQSEQKYHQDVARESERELAEVQRSLDACRKQLEDESILRVDLENRLQSVKEENDFNKKVYKEEIAEVRKQKKIEIKELSKQEERHYQLKLQEALDKIRSQCADDIAANRAEDEAKFRNKIASLEASAAHAREEAADARTRLHELRQELEYSTASYAEMEKRIAEAEGKSKELAATLKSERDRHALLMNYKQSEIDTMRQQIEQMTIDYKDLMDIKVALDVELEAYNQLLEGEEKRLNISTPHNSPEKSQIRGSSPLKRGVKRRRYEMEREVAKFESTESSGELAVDHDEYGTFVRVSNNGAENINIGGFVLTRTNDTAEVKYKFKKTILKSGNSITVWSKATKDVQKSASEIVMKDQSWLTGEAIRTSLTNADDEEVAWKESHLTRGLSLENGEGDKNCAIM